MYKTHRPCSNKKDGTHTLIAPSGLSGEDCSKMRKQTIERILSGEVAQWLEGYLRLENISDFLNQRVLLVHECVREGY